LLVSQQLNGLYFASLYRNCIQFLPAETLAPQLEYRSFIKDAVQRTQKCRVLTPESRIFVAGENHVKIAFLVVATVDQVKEQPRIQAGSDTVLRFYLRQTVSKDGGAEVLCSPVGLITESDCAPVRKMVLAVGAPQRYVTVPASELQTYLDALPRLLTEHHVITLRGTNSNIVSVKDFYGCGSLTLRADKVGDCVFTKDVIVENCSIPVIMEGLKWELDGTASPETYCISCRDSTIYANICSFNGHAKTGRGVVSWGNSSAVLAGCALHNLEIAVEASWGGRIGVYGEDPKTECSGNTIGIYLRQGGLVLLGDLVPDLLGGTYNERNRMNAIIKGGKFV